MVSGRCLSAIGAGPFRSLVRHSSTAIHRAVAPWRHLSRGRHHGFRNAPGRGRGPAHRVQRVLPVQRRAAPGWFRHSSPALIPGINRAGRPRSTVGVALIEASLASATCIPASAVWEAHHAASTAALSIPASPASRPPPTTPTITTIWARNIQTPGAVGLWFSRRNCRRSEARSLRGKGSSL